MMEEVIHLDVEGGLSARLIADAPGYAITACGRVFSCHRNGGRGGLLPLWKELATQVHPTGYVSITLRINGRHQMRRVHRIVLDAFIGPQPSLQARHMDGNKLNNHLSNLRWGSQADNEADKRLVGRDNSGERHGQSKLTNRQAAIARELRQRHPGKSGVVRFVSRWFGISTRQASFVCRGLTYTSNSHQE